jgi:hypothetical protein
MAMLTFRTSSHVARIAVCALTLGALIAASPAPVPSSTPVGPISIESCDVQTARSGFGMGNVTVFGKGYNFFKIAFTNQTTVPADQLKFQIDFGASRIVIGDSGTFVPAVETTHTLRDRGSSVVASARPGGTGPTICSVIFAHFTDGTAYTAPDAVLR